MTNLFKLAFIVCIIAIEYLATTTLSIPVVEQSWDKANHFVAFFTLYVLLHYGYSNLNIKTKILYLLLFAIQIEIVQYFIPNRYFSLLDVVADSIGIIIGIGVVYFIKE